jgi:pimeloyl-ACP methyl ester carboxylesterase
VLLGADPVDLERLAEAHDLCAAHLARVRTRIRAVDRGAWRGPAARRWWAHLDATVMPSLVAAGGRCAAAGKYLRAQAGEQRRASLPEPGHTMLLEDRRGDGRVVSLRGEPDAPVAVVLVPGVGTDRGDAARLADDAAEVWRYLAARAGSDVAVVSWLGYDPPDHVLLGLDRGPAERGAAALARHVAELRAAGAERVVVVGHSYGGLVATSASARGMAADELVLLGAPGLGVRELDELELPPDADLWAAAARLVHGPDPVELALSLPTSLDGHSAYLADPVLLSALAEVVLAEPVPSAHRRAQGQ